MPFDVMRDLEEEGAVGKVHDTFFAMSGNCTVTRRCGEIGEEMAAEIKRRGTIDGAILTST